MPAAVRGMVGSSAAVPVLLQQMGAACCAGGACCQALYICCNNWWKEHSTTSACKFIATCQCCCDGTCGTARPASRVGAHKAPTHHALPHYRC